MADGLTRPAGAARIWAGAVSTTTMLALITLMVPARNAPGRAHVDPAVWWYVARASGLTAWALLAVSVVAGLLLTTRFTPGNTRSWTQALHGFLGPLAVVFTVVHLVSVLGTDRLGIGPRELLVPFARPSNPVAQGCGVLAFYLLISVAVTSWARALLPWRWWRRLHLLTLPMFGLACAHTALAGTDTPHPVLRWISLILGTAILILATFRLCTARGSAPVPVRPQPPVPPSVSTTTSTGMGLLIGQTRWEADDVVSLSLRCPNGTALPSWEPGAHIELALPSGRCRQYSLCGDPDDTRYYRIAVLQVPAGRGGSVEVHTGTRVGQLIAVSGPRNQFPLVASSAYLFIAGGIGITAMLAMATRGCRRRRVETGVLRAKPWPHGLFRRGARAGPRPGRGRAPG